MLAPQVSSNLFTTFFSSKLTSGIGKGISAELPPVIPANTISPGLVFLASVIASLAAISPASSGIG